MLMWAGFVWRKIATSGSLVNTVMGQDFLFSPTQPLLVAQDELCSMELGNSCNVLRIYKSDTISY
jgi:hypothetical protein